MKAPENVFPFEDNCVWTCCRDFFQLWQEYMWSAIKVLTNGSKISDPIKR